MPIEFGNVVRDNSFSRCFVDGFLFHSEMPFRQTTTLPRFPREASISKTRHGKLGFSVLLRGFHSESLEAGDELLQGDFPDCRKADLVVEGSTYRGYVQITVPSDLRHSNWLLEFGELRDLSNQGFRY